MGIELFIVFPYYPFTIHGISSDGPFSIPDIGNMCHLPFFLVNQALSLSILFIFSENQLLLHWFSLFLISLIYALVFIISFPLFALGLISSSIIDLLGVSLGYRFYFLFVF